MILIFFFSLTSRGNFSSGVLFFPLFPKHVSLPSRTGREEESEGKETAGEGEFQKQALEKEKNEDSRPFF